MPTLRALLASRHPVVGVVTQPDRPRGRGHRTTTRLSKPLRRRPASRSCSRSVSRTLRSSPPSQRLDADLGVVAAYGKILTDGVLAIPRLGFLNVHASLLPEYRGAAPVHRAVIAGEPETGVTIMRVVKALDAGPMLDMCSRPIGPDETSDQVESSLAALGASLLVSAVAALVAGSAAEIPQDESAATYAPRLTKEDGAIDWSRTATEIHNLIRGLHPWPHAFAFHGGRRYILRRSAAATEPAAAPPGTVVEAAGDRLSVATGRGLLRVVEIQAEGGRPLPTREFLAGHPFPVGTALTASP